jgi:hypothetical protein
VAKNLISVATITPDKDNTLFQIAVELVNQSSRNIFLTGKAGTGKTTFLKYIRENCPKQIAVAAPTGVAAINAGGVTIHSLFQLPLSPYIPDVSGSDKNGETVNRQNLLSRLRMNSEKKKVLREMELLIIDEISMVRSDTLDAVDAVLRHVRGRHNEIFGGVQVLFIGDMFQLPPVIKEPEWNLLSGYYASPYFFDSQVIREEQPLYIEFDKIYRQSDERFIRLLNQVRNNELDEDGYAILESRFQPTFRRSKDDGFIILTTHNETARQINNEKLQELDGRVYSFNADIQDDFPPNAYPADEVLNLKMGAQIMFIKNDSDRTKRYYNGKIGIVTRLDDEKIFIQCKDEPAEIEVKKEKWENIRYDLNKTTRQIEEKPLGSFSQYPLRLAWAITIHKSQGLTFEKAIIDAGKSFAAGQVYVALSRCTNLEGMLLQSMVRSNSLFTDQRIVQFSASNSSTDELQRELAIARKNYQLGLLILSFDFKKAIQYTKDLEGYIGENPTSFNGDSQLWVMGILDKINTLQDTADKFHVWLRTQFLQPGLPEENTSLQERAERAAQHFVKELDLLTELILQSPVITDSRLHAKEYNDGVKEIFAELSMKKYLLQGFKGKLDVDAWHKRKRSFAVPPCYVNAYAGEARQRIESPHPVLYQRLRKMRDAICEKKDQPIYMVAGSKTLEEMVSYLPQTPEELEDVSGFGKVKVEKYGQQFLEIIQQYCKEHDLVSPVREKATKRPRKEKKEKPGTKEPANDTKRATLSLYKEGKKLNEIAEQRKLALSTIETHLAYFIEKGEVNVDELVSPDKRILIEPLLKDDADVRAGSIKSRLGEAVSFGEIRWMMASAVFQKHNETE